MSSRFRSICFFSVIAVALLCSCASSKSLGHGYRLVPVTVDVPNRPGSFEGLAHYEDLYYRSQRLGTVGSHSISPSGRFALFEQNGKIILFDANSGKTLDVTDGAFAIPKEFQWNESAGTVHIDYYTSHSPTTIILLK